MNSRMPIEGRKYEVGTLYSVFSRPRRWAFLRMASARIRPGGLAAEPAGAAVGEDDVVEHLGELANPDEALGDRDEIELVGEQPPHQGGAGADHVLARRHHLARGEVEELADGIAQHRQRGVGVLGQARALVGEHSFFHLQDGGRDLLRLHVALGILEGEFIQRHSRFAGELGFGTVGIVHRPRAAEFERYREVVDGVEVHQALALEVHQKPAAHPVREIGPAVAEVGELLAPVNRHVSPENATSRSERTTAAEHGVSPSRMIVALTFEPHAKTRFSRAGPARPSICSANVGQGRHLCRPR